MPEVAAGSVRCIALDRATKRKQYVIQFEQNNGGTYSSVCARAC